MKAAYNDQYSSRPSRPVIKNLFDNIHKSNCDAVIIDLRNNRGGNLEDIDFFVGQFTSKPFEFAYARYKSGTGRLDYTPLLPMSVTPQDGAKDFNKPIIILTDIYTASLCESVVTAFKGLGNNVTIIGEHTYGTSGFLAAGDLSTLGGSFELPSFGYVHLSDAALFGKDGKMNFAGIQPDIEVKYNTSSIAQMQATGVDIQLEKAIQFINH